MNASDLHDLPLTDDRTLQEGLEALLAPVVRRQLWMLFLDERGALTGPLMPIDDYPRSPHDTSSQEGSEGDPHPAAQGIAECFATLMDEFGFANLVLVWERPGAAQLDADTRAWARELHTRFGALGAGVRAQCLLSDGGLRVIALDDLL